MVNSPFSNHMFPGLFSIRNGLLTLLLLALSGCGGSGNGGNSTSSVQSSAAVSSSSETSSIASSVSSVVSSSISLMSSSSSVIGSSSSVAVSSSSSVSSLIGDIVFDDFSYTMTSQMEANGWYVRSGSGGPGVSGASWSKNLVTFFVDPDDEDNQMMRMKASTEGTGNTTTQSQVTYEGNHLRGTYAARVFFTNSPASGPDGDKVVETFYTITTLEFDMDPDYSEIDFEYLPNGGWGQSQPTMFMTTWETYDPDPWTQDSISETEVSDHSGWHTLVAQVDEDSVRYYIDGELMATHTGHVYPETNMSLNFNIWFIQGGLESSTTERVYEQEVDWVYFVDQEILSPAEVDAQIEALRAQTISYRDTVN
jgi:hypothetical protein